jgi:hypothetical protein
MNKFVNILTFLLLAPTFGVAIFAGFDLPVEFLKSSGNNLPFLSQIFLVFAVIFLMINGRRAMKRWTGLRMVNQQTKFQWNHEIDKKRKSQENMYLIMEGIVHLLSAFAFSPLVALVALGVCGWAAWALVARLRGDPLRVRLATDDAGRIHLRWIVGCSLIAHWAWLYCKLPV